MIAARCLPEFDKLCQDLQNLTSEINQSSLTANNKPIINVKNPNIKTFILPKDPKLLLYKKFRLLCDEIKKCQETYLHSNQKITDIEELLIPARHHLSLLQMQESSLLPLEGKLNEFDLQEGYERDIVENFKTKTKLKRQFAHEQRLLKFKNEKEFKETQEKIVNQQKQENLETKRAELLQMLKKEMHEVFKIIFILTLSIFHLTYTIHRWK